MKIFKILFVALFVLGIYGAYDKTENSGTDVAKIDPGGGRP